MPSSHFRAGVVAVVRRSDGLLLAFQRAGQKGAWQLPQGGLDRGEAPVEGAWRELEEETGLGRDHVRLVDEFPHWVTQEWPHRHRRRDAKRLGQVHRWFTFQVVHDGIEPTPDGVEFDDWRWATDKWLLKKVVDWRRPAYRQVLRRRR